MLKTWFVVVCVVAAVILPVAASAVPTGAPLFTYPLEPCRILDTRVSLGPLLGGWGMDVHVRGSNLLASEGAEALNCGVPPEAEAVMVNVTVLQPTSGGYLKVSGVGTVAGVYGAGNYSRLTFRALENDANEMLVALCNYQLFPAPHLPCGYATTNGRYSDFQIQSKAPDGSTVHIVVDVVGYLAR